MVKLYLNYFPHSKMAISEHKNGHFEEIRGWLQILELGSNSTIFHLLFDTYDSPGAVFIWKWEKYRPYLLVCMIITAYLIRLWQFHLAHQYTRRLFLQFALIYSGVSLLNFVYK